MNRRSTYASSGVVPHEGGIPAKPRLRILATTDLHMQIVGHDYVGDRSVGHHGLAGIATLMTQEVAFSAKLHCASMAPILS